MSKSVCLLGCLLASSPAFSSDAFTRASAFIQRTARPLERALFAFHFEKGSRDAVLAELAKFQNADGGFASCLEPDVRWCGSSPLGAKIALTVLDEVDAPATDPLVRSAIRYLLSTYDSVKGYWPAVPQEVNSAPHAPWWNFDKAKGRCEVESPFYPTASILAHLRPYASALPAGFLDRVTRATLDRAAAAPDPLSYADASILLDLAERDAALLAKLRKTVAQILVRDPNEWVKYNPQPLSFVSSPASPLYAGIEKDVAAHLDYLIARQEADGGWALNWSWEKIDADGWAQARREWRGIVALENLRKLRAFGR